MLDIDKICNFCILLPICNFRCEEKLDQFNYYSIIEKEEFIDKTLEHFNLNLFCPFCGNIHLEYSTTFGHKFECTKCWTEFNIYKENKTNLSSYSVNINLIKIPHHGKLPEIVKFDILIDILKKYHLTNLSQILLRDSARKKICKDCVKLKSCRHFCNELFAYVHDKQVEYYKQTQTSRVIHSVPFLTSAIDNLNSCAICNCKTAEYIYPTGRDNYVSFVCNDCKAGYAFIDHDGMEFEIISPTVHYLIDEYSKTEIMSFVDIKNNILKGGYFNFYNVAISLDDLISLKIMS